MPFDIAVDPQNRSVCIGVRDYDQESMRSRDKLVRNCEQEYGIMNKKIWDHEQESIGS